jgi:hypothetical protein
LTKCFRISIIVRFYPPTRPLTIHRYNRTEEPLDNRHDANRQKPFHKKVDWWHLGTYVLFSLSALGEYFFFRRITSLFRRRTR